MVPTVSCLCKELDLPPEEFALAAMRYRRNPRVIVKCDTEKNRVLMLERDGTSKDRHMMQSIMEGTLKVDGFSIRDVVDANQDYFQKLQQFEDSK